MDRPHLRLTALPKQIRASAVLLALVLATAALLATAAPAGARAVLPTHMLWWDIYAPTVAVDRYEAVAPTIDGGFVAAGITNDNIFGDAAGTDMLVTKFAADDSGVHREWVRTWDNPINHLADHAWAVQTDLLGNVIVCGYTVTAGGARFMAIVKWDAAGTFKWARSLTADLPGGNAIAYDLTCDGAGDIYVCGSTETAAGVRALVVRKLDATLGDPLWKGEYEGTADSFNQGSAIALDQFANCYVVGYGERVVGADNDIVVVKFDSLGNLDWARRIDGSDHRRDEGADIVMGTSTVTIAGYLGSDAAGTRSRVAVATYTLGGTRKWLRTWSETSTAACRPTALARDRYGNVAVAGSATRSGGIEHAFLVKWDKYGHRKWAKVSYRAGEKRWFNDVVARGGTFWVGGATVTGASDADALVARYGPDGTRTWFSLYTGAGGLGDGFRALCLGVGSGVFAAGYSGSAATGDDALAAKYTR